MPWGIDDVDRHKKGLTEKQKRQWVRIANSVLKRCMEKGGSEEECAASAIRQANGVVGNSARYYAYQRNKQGDYEIRFTVHQGEATIIVPVVMMVEGVHHGSYGPLLHKIEDLGKYPESWNGIPVVINHPQEDGTYISANYPDVVDKQVVGRVYNTIVEDNKLKAEVWLNENKLSEVAPEILEKIYDGEVLEVSVGVYVDEGEEEGEYNGKNYRAIARNHRPDHLAILSGYVGACSVKDGCGLGVNQNMDDMEINEKVSAMEEKRKELGMSVEEFYAISRDPPSESKLPIFDEAHVRNAMARFNQVKGVSIEEKKKARRKIIAKAKHFGIDTEGFEEATKELVSNSFSEELLTRIRSIESIVRGLCKPNSSEWFYVEGIFDNYVIYAKESSNGTQYYRQNYEFEGGKVKFVGEPVEVTKKVDYVNVNLSRTKFKNGGDSKMDENKKGKIDALIANSNGRWTECDRPFLEGLSEELLDKLTPVVIEKEKVVQVNAISDEEKAMLEAYKQELKQRRDKMISEIQANTSKEQWPDDVLNGMKDDVLKRLHESVVKAQSSVDYTLAAGGFNVNVGLKDVEPLYPIGVS